MVQLLGLVVFDVEADWASGLFVTVIDVLTPSVCSLSTVLDEQSVYHEAQICYFLPLGVAFLSMGGILLVAISCL